jgi:hypothetical protein
MGEGPGDVWRMRLSSRRELDGALAELVAGLREARAHGVPAVLIDARAYAGPIPSVTERWQSAEAFASAAGGRCKVAVVARPEYLDPTNFGVLVAQNRGLALATFVSEELALEWLTAAPQPVRDPIGT